MECIVSFLHDVIISIADNLFEFTHRCTIGRIQYKQTFVLGTRDRDIEFVVDLLKFLVSDLTTLQHLIRKVSSSNENSLFTAIKTITDAHIVILTDQLTLSGRRVNIELITNGTIDGFRNVASSTGKRINGRHVHKTLTDTLEIVHTDVFVLGRTIRELSEEIVGNIGRHGINTGLNIPHSLLNGR